MGEGHVRRGLWQLWGGQGIDRVKCTPHACKKVRVWLSGRVIAEFV